MSYPEPKENELSESVKKEIKEEIRNTDQSSQEISENYENATSSQVAGIMAAMSADSSKNTEDQQQVTRLKSIVSDYEEFYNSPRHSDEEYKWNHVERFQSKWPGVREEEGLEFLEALESAFEKEENLIGWRARAQMEDIFEERPEESTEAVKNLLEGEDDIRERVDEFFEVFWRKDDMPGNRRATSFFLASLYPERFVHYKYTEFKQFFEKFGLDLQHGFNSDNRSQHYLEVNEKAKDLLEKISIQDKDLWHVQDLIYYFSVYWMPDEIEEVLDNIYSRGMGTYTRLFTLKCFFEKQEDGSVPKEELDEYILSQAKKQNVPGKNPYSYKQNGNNVFSNYDPFTRTGDRYEVKEEYRDYIVAMAHYVEDLWENVSEVNYWQVAPGQNAKNWGKMNEEGIMAVGYKEFPDLSEVESKDELKNIANEVKDWTKSRIPHHVSNLWKFLQIEEGDKIIANKGKRAVVGMGQVKNNYYYEERSDKFPHRIDVEWVKTGEEKIPTNHEFGRTVSRISDMKYEQIIKSYEGKDIEKYFWITAPSELNLKQMSRGDTFFYSKWSDKEHKRRNSGRIDSAEPRDQVLLYESGPEKEVAAEFEIKGGLHKEDHEERGSVEGITLEFRNRVEGIPWEKVKSLPSMENSELVSNDLNSAVYELSELQYKEITAVGEKQEETRNLEKFISSPNFSIDIPNELYFENESDLRNEISASLNSGKNIIFTGPPGTGKTKLAKSISKQVSEEESENSVDEVEGSVFTTATADWTAFDTIGGYMPSQGNGNELEFNPGQFLKCFRKESGEVTNKWLVIDEINRSDIDKAFGQLFSVLSGDSVELPYKKDGHVKLEKVDEDDDTEEIERNEDIYPITDSWRLIATMNTYDKTSLYDMSYAFMRRFNFIHVGVPELKTEEGYNFSLLNPEIDENYASVWNSEEVLEENDFYKDLTALWHEVNRQRDIGPSIIKDIIDFVDSHPGNMKTALAQAVNSLILPQFEGLRREKQEQFIKELKMHSENDLIGVNDSLVEEKAVNMFSISLDDE